MNALNGCSSSSATVARPRASASATSATSRSASSFFAAGPQDRDFSAAKLARLSGLSCSSHVERELGLIATSDAVKNGVKYRGRIKTTIGVDNAERLLRAMGLQARDIERVIDGEELS